MRTLLAALGVASAVASAGGGPPVETLYRSGSGPIVAFAQDGQLLAWFARSRRGCNTVHVYSLASGTAVTLPRQAPGAHNVTCRWDVGAADVRLAVAARAPVDGALWTLGEQSPVPYDYALSAGVLDRNERRFRELAHTRNGDGLWLGGIAGDGDTLVYSVTAVSYVDRVSCLAKPGPAACRLRLSAPGSGIHRLSGRKDPLLRGTGPALAVAAAGGAVAYVPAGRVGRHGRPLPAPGRAIPIRDARTGRLLAAAKPRGVPEAIALAPGLLAVLARDRGVRRIAWYDATDGVLQGSIAVPRSTAPELSASTRFVVFRVGRSIRALDVVTGGIRRLADAGSTPIGLSIEGTRIAWAENRRGRGSILAVRLG